MTTPTAIDRTTSATDETGRPKPRRRRKFRMVSAAIVVAAVAALGFGVVAPSASAADGVSYCFNGTWGAPIANNATTLLAYYNGTWYSVATGRTNNNGCGVFYTAYNSYYLKVKIGYPNEPKVHGETPLMAPPGRGYANLGTGYAWYG